MAWRKPANLREWAGIFYRHKKKFFFPAIAVMIAMVISSHWVPRVYRAEAMFERTNDAALQQMGADTISTNLRMLRTALMQHIKGRSAIEQLIDDLELTQDLPHTEDGELTAQGQLAKNDLVRKLQGMIRIKFRVQSAAQDHIVVSYSDPDRKLAPQIVNQLVENYIRRTRQQLDAMLLNAKSFFEREVNRYRAAVTELESKKLRFELDNPGLLPNDPASVDGRLSELRAEHQTAANELHVTQEKRNRLAEWIKTQPEFIETSRTGQNPETAVFYDKIAAIESELEGHLYTMGRTEEHPAVIRARERLAALQEQLSEMGVDDVVIGKEIQPNTNRIAAEREVESMSGILTALERRVSELSQEVEQYEILKRNFFVVRNEYIQIQSELKEATDQVNFWEGNLRETTISLTAEIGQRGVRLRVLERAPDLARPSKPTISGIMTMAAGAGFGLGAFMILAAELMDHSFRGVEHAVDDLKLPVLGAVNEIVSPSELFRRKVLGWGVYPAIGAVMVLALVASIILASLSLTSPQRYDQLVTNPGQFIENTLFGG